jgi:hypothetical protein
MGMGEKEFKELKKALLKQKKAVEKSPKAARKMLEDIGVIDADGNYKKPYESLVHFF